MAKGTFSGVATGGGLGGRIGGVQVLTREQAAARPADRSTRTINGGSVAVERRNGRNRVVIRLNTAAGTVEIDRAGLAQAMRAVRTGGIARINVVRPSDGARQLLDLNFRGRGPGRGTGRFQNVLRGLMQSRISQERRVRAARGAEIPRQPMATGRFGIRGGNRR